MTNYSEQILIEQPAIEVFKSLGYNYQDCFNKKFGENGTLAREIAESLESALEQFSNIYEDLE